MTTGLSISATYWPRGHKNTVSGLSLFSLATHNKMPTLSDIIGQLNGKAHHEEPIKQHVMYKASQTKEASQKESRDYNDSNDEDVEPPKPKTEQVNASNPAEVENKKSVSRLGKLKELLKKKQ